MFMEDRERESENGTHPYVIAPGGTVINPFAINYKKRMKEEKKTCRNVALYSK